MPRSRRPPKPHSVHVAADLKIFGKAYPKMHHAKDWPAQVVGPNHRMYFHDIPSNLVLAAIEYPNDLAGAFNSGLIHDAFDVCLTAAKRQVNQSLNSSLGSNSKLAKRYGPSLDPEELLLQFLNSF